MTRAAAVASATAPLDRDEGLRLDFVFEPSLPATAGRRSHPAACKRHWARDPSRGTIALLVDAGVLPGRTHTREAVQWLTSRFDLRSRSSPTA